MCYLNCLCNHWYVYSYRANRLLKHLLQFFYIYVPENSHIHDIFFIQLAILKVLSSHVCMLSHSYTVLSWA